jgi:1-aminocyclopropane-1-carboxylate deaminase/D-cysteine desulfhydrase-like pyridoxal-dependent ACC family enzyme
MPELSADKIIGKTLYAKRQLDKLNSSLQKIGTFAKGQSVGVVYSYVVRNGQVYWLFNDVFGKPYLVKHDSTAFQFSAGVQEAVKKQEAEKEKEEIEQKGKIPFYIEKYGKWVLGAFILVTLAREYIKKK